MKRIISNLEKAKELAFLICEKTPYKAHVAYINALCFAQGYTITIKKSFLKSLQIVYDQGDIDYYTSSEELSELAKEILPVIEKLTAKEISIRGAANITLGGR